MLSNTVKRCALNAGMQVFLHSAKASGVIRQEDTLAFKWRLGKKKDDYSVIMTEDDLQESVESPSSDPVTESLPEERVADAVQEEPVAEQEVPKEIASEENSEGDIPAEPFVVSEEESSPENEAEESAEPVIESVEKSDETVDGEVSETADEVIDEASSENEVPEDVMEQESTDTTAEEVLEADVPAEQIADGEDKALVADSADDAQEDASEEIKQEIAEREEAPIEEPAQAEEGSAAQESETAEPLPEEAFIDDGVVAQMSLPEEAVKDPAPAAESESTATPEEGDGSFVMDDDYMRAFMEEAGMDDYIYGGNFEEKQDLLDRIADNAETLAEEGTALLEQKEKEKEENKKKEPRYNEKGELLDDDGKVVLKRSLENKLILADTRERRYYNKLKNEILSYQGVKAEMQTATEVFRHGKQVVARLTIAGFTRIYFALEPDEFDVERYKQADRTEVDFEDAKMLIRVRNDDEFAIAVELLAIMMGALNIDRLEAPVTEDYLPAFPRREDAVLEKKGKMLAFEEKDEQALIKEKRAEERKAAGISEEPEEVPVEEEVKEEPLVILPLTLDNKIHQSTNTIKLLYSKLKNELLSYKSVKAEMTVKNENFKVAKKIIARMTVVGESVRLYLALDPKAYSTRKYKHRDASDQQGYEGTLLMMKISGENERDLASKLIAELMQKLSLERNKRYAYVPYAEKYPYIKNGVFKGDEDKPRVKHEGEEYADIYGELTEHLRSQMGATDAWGVPKGYTAEDAMSARDLLEIQRSKAKTMNAGVALATPIVYFYDAAITEEGEVKYLNVQQVLNDKFLGKMIPQEYFAIAESSSRIEELNFFALETVVKDCNENPTMRFVLKISCRLLLKQETLTKLVDKMRTENGNLILAFDCAMLEAVGFVGISAINTLKQQGALIMIDNAESASMRVLTEYDIDYLRLDSRYYDGKSSKRLAHLDMITGYADVQNIITTSINCEHKEDARILLDHGVKLIQGDAVARPMRLINLALTNIKPVPKVKKDGEKN